MNGVLFCRRASIKMGAVLKRAVVWGVVMMVVVMSLSGEVANGDPTCSKLGDFKCNPGRCCSKFNYCGSSQAYCGRGNCIAQCPSNVSPLHVLDVSALNTTSFSP
eukprot:Gb_07504 [translate_table: standard]